MAIFGRRRKEADVRDAIGASASTGSGDDSLRAIEDLFESVSVTALPYADRETENQDTSVSAARHVAFGDAAALPPLRADFGSDFVDREQRRGVTPLRASVDTGAEAGSEVAAAVQTQAQAQDAPAVSPVLGAVPPEPSVAPTIPDPLTPRTDTAVPSDSSAPLHSHPQHAADLGRGSSSSLIGIEEGERTRMANLEQSVQDLLSIDGATGVAVVDSASGMALAQGGYPGFDLSIAAAGNSNVVRAKLQTMNELGLTGKIDDILITLDEQYHLINVLSGAGNNGLFVYLVLDRAKSNLALARHKLTGVSSQIEI